MKSKTLIVGLIDKLMIILFDKLYIMKGITHILVILMFLMSFSSCATKYRSHYLKGGYRDSKTSDDIYEVKFRGNTYTSSQKEKDYCLLRCAEIAKENDYPYFKVMDKSGSWFMGVSKKTIKLCKQKPDGDYVYDADSVIKSMKEKYRHLKLKDESGNPIRSSKWE